MGRKFRLTTRPPAAGGRRSIGGSAWGTSQLTQLRSGRVKKVLLVAPLALVLIPAHCGGGQRLYSLSDVRRAFTDHGFTLSVPPGHLRARAQWDIAAYWGRPRRPYQPAVPGDAGEVRIIIWRRISFAATSTEETNAGRAAKAIEDKNVVVIVRPHISPKHRRQLDAALAELSN